MDGPRQVLVVTVTIGFLIIMSKRTTLLWVPYYVDDDDKYLTFASDILFWLSFSDPRHEIVY